MEKNWEAIYEAILKDVVSIVKDSSKGHERKIHQIIELLVSNDFIEEEYDQWGH